MSRTPVTLILYAPYSGEHKALYSAITKYYEELGRTVCLNNSGVDLYKVDYVKTSNTPAHSLAGRHGMEPVLHDCTNNKYYKGTTLIDKLYTISNQLYSRVR